MLYTHLHTQATDLESLNEEWNALLARTESNLVFLTYQWQSAWWKAYHPGELFIITVRNNQGQLLGIAPWFIETSAEFGRTVRTIGCVDVTDYLDVIVHPNHTEAVLTEFVHILIQQQERLDRVNLCNLPQYSTALRHLPTILSNCGFSIEVCQQEVCPVIMLPTSFDAYLESLDKKQRHELKRKIRRAESSEDVKWYIVGTDHDLDAEVKRFLELMASSHTAKKDFLDDPANVSFFRSIAPQLFEQGWLQLCFLTIAGTPAAAYMNFTYNGHVLVYNSGLLPDQFAHLSPGIVLLAYLIQHAIAEGFRVFDFLRGNEVYKYRMGAQDTPVTMLIATPQSN